MLKLRREGLKVTLDKAVIPAQGSSDVPVIFMNDEDEYSNFIVQPAIGWYDKYQCFKSKLRVIKDNQFTIPKDAFVNNGLIYISIGLVNPSNPNQIEQTLRVTARVEPAPYVIDVLPTDEETWQDIVKNYMDELYSKEYEQQFDEALNNVNEAINTANTASQNANEALNTSNQTNELINNKLESGELKGEAGKSILYGEGVPTDEIGNVGDMYINTSGDEPYPFYLFAKNGEGWTPIWSANGVNAQAETSLESNSNINVPTVMAVNKALVVKQLLYNNDFQINQRGQNEYNLNAELYGLDYWQHRQGKYYDAIIVSQIEGGGCHVKLGTGAGAGLRQYISASKSCLGKPYTAVISIDGVVYKGTVKMRTTSDPDYIGAISNDMFGVSVFYDEANKYIVYSLWVPEGNKEFDINYCDLFDGSIAYPHKKEDYDIDLIKCQSRLVVYDEARLPCTFSYTDTDYDSIIVTLCLPTNFKENPNNISCDSKEMISSHSDTIYTDFTMASKRLYGANIIRILWKKDSGVFPSTLKDPYVYMKNLVISCELE